MNMIEYYKAVAKEPDFDQKYTFMVPIEDLEYTKHEEGNEVRLMKNSSHVQLRHELADSGGNDVPVSVHGSTDGYGMDDGHNRVREMKALGMKHVKCIMSNYNSPSERIWGMLHDNILPAHTPATSADIVGVMVKDIKEHFALGSDFGSITKEDVMAHLRENMKSKPLHGNLEKSIVNKVMTELPSGVKKYTNYTSKRDAALAFSEINPWGMDIAKPGEICRDATGQEWVVYFAGSDTWVRQNGIHSTFNKKKSNPEVKTMLVGFDEKIYYNSGCLTTFRNKLLSEAKEANHTMLESFGGNRKLYDRFAVLPQVLKGSTPEDHDKLVPGMTHDL